MSTSKRITALLTLCIAQAKLNQAVRGSLAIGDRSGAFDLADVRMQLGLLKRRAYEACL